jgi:hypothetical protein
LSDDIPISTLLHLLWMKLFLYFFLSVGCRIRISLISIREKKSYISSDWIIFSLVKLWYALPGHILRYFLLEGLPYCSRGILLHWSCCNRLEGRISETWVLGELDAPEPRELFSSCNSPSSFQNTWRILHEKKQYATRINREKRQIYAKHDWRNILEGLRKAELGNRSRHNSQATYPSQLATWLLQEIRAILVDDGFMK